MQSLAKVSPKVIDREYPPGLAKMSGATHLGRGQPPRKEFQLLMKNLELLHIDPLPDAGFEEEDFRGKNASAIARHVLHGLYCAYDKKAAQRKLKNVWPVKPGESDKEFRIAIFTWISTLQENPNAALFLQGFSAALLLRPGTPQYLMFLTGLSTFVLHDRLKDKIELAIDFSHEALPRNVIKFAMHEKKFSCVTLQKQLIEIEADYANKERHLKESLSNLTLSLQNLRAEAEKCESDESAERFTQIDKELRNQNELISTRMGQIEEHRALMDGVITIDLIGGLEKCNAIIDQFLEGYDKNTCEEQHRNVAVANVHLDAMKKTVERLQAQRETLERINADTAQCLEETIARLPAELVAGLDLKFKTSSTNPQINVEDFIGQLTEAFRNRHSKKE